MISHRLITATLLAVVCVAANARDEAVRIDVGDTTLAGTLELPRRDPVAAALIIAGSGPTDRDGNSAIVPGDNDSLRYLAEALADARIASLRYDKRMVGESVDARLTEEDLRFDQLADDAVALADYLRERFGVPVFLVGHSEGGQIALTAAARAPFAGVAMLASPGAHPADLIAGQLRGKVPPELLDAAVETMDALRSGRRVDDPPEQLGALLRTSVQPYLISWFQYDPAQQAAALEQPLLLVYGTTDIQVGVENGEALLAAQPDARLVVIDGMNHVLKRFDGSPAEHLASYGNPDLPLADGVAEAVIDFVTEQVSSR